MKPHYPFDAHGNFVGELPTLRSRRYKEYVPPRNKDGLRTDGPTLKQWVAAGYRAENYPPQGYALKLERRT